MTGDAWGRQRAPDQMGRAGQPSEDRGSVSQPGLRVRSGGSHDTVAAHLGDAPLVRHSREVGPCCLSDGRAGTLCGCRWEVCHA